jgi:hypothetical protein
MPSWSPWEGIREKERSRYDRNGYPPEDNYPRDCIISDTWKKRIGDVSWPIDAPTVAPVFAPWPTASIEPENPTTLDEITLQVGGVLPNTCWQYSHHDFAVTDDSTFTIEVVVPVVGYICLMVVGNYWFQCPLGRMEAGTYTAHIVENSNHNEWPFEPPPLGTTFDLVFEVAPPVPTDRVSWGRVKALYD